ncbi:replication-relaxation family protein [Parafrankia sp. FMc6]|uniref:replication-relaxation family protein n=1 Tax=Parafrankia soli TaxID=2599596 RepID=UPI0034D6636F
MWYLASRLTARDRWLLAMLAEHQILTTRQIALLCFSGDRTARARLALLAQLRAVDRVRPLRGDLATPFHYTLGPAGARVLAAQSALPVGQIYRRDRALSLIYSRLLDHTVGANGLFVALAHASRPRPATDGLVIWWSEQRAVAMWRQWVRPDGFGTWYHQGRRLDFFCEYDTGTEPLTRVAAKIPGYARLAVSSGMASPVLIWLPTQTRETNLRRQLGVTGGAVVITASPPPDTAPPEPGNPQDAADLAAARPVWLPLGSTARADLDGLTIRFGSPAAPPGSPDEDDEQGAPPPRPPQPRRPRP